MCVLVAKTTKAATISLMVHNRADAEKEADGTAPLFSHGAISE